MLEVLNDHSNNILPQSPTNAMFEILNDHRAKRPRTCDSKSPRQNAVDELFNIHPMNLLRDFSTAKYHTLELVEDHWKDLLQSIEIVKDCRRRSLHTEKESIEALIPSNKPCCLSPVLRTDTGFERTLLRSMPTQVLRQLAMSDFLTAGDLGRFLLQISKTFSHDLGEEFVYFQLCRSRWKNCMSIPSLIKERGYPWLYRKLSQGLEIPKERDWPTLPEPSLSLHNLALLVNVHDGSQEMLSEILRGDSLQELFRHGKCFIPLTRPKFIGDFPSTDERCILPPTSDDFEEWTATMHAARLDTHQCCCVHESSYVCLSQSKGDWGNERIWNLHFSPDLTGLELTDEGKQLEARIREFDRLKNRHSHEGIYFEATVLASKFTCPKDPTKVRLVFDGLKVAICTTYEIMQDIYDSEAESIIHGVSALHLVEQLRGLT
jgi:hypothetical protein